MSGLEALSLVCSIMQVISFTKELAMTCKDIYDGRATVDDITQENTASIKSLLDDMDKCSDAVQQRTQNEKDLHEIARKCSTAAQALQTEIQLITQYHKPGSAMKAFIGGIRSFTHKRKVKELFENLQKYQKTLETHILVHVYTKTNALQIQGQSNSPQLSETMRHFISQVADGHTEMASLINRDGTQTRQQIHQSEMRVKNSINAAQVEADLEAKRNCLLQSLKFESMNARRTDIKIANEATYVSFFKSLEFAAEPTSGSAAAAWADFVDWLQSDEQAFWIQGKPGAGKSTLVKFLLQHENTSKALNKWNHNPLIVSHFFWKPGNILQRNFRGLLCSLSHQLLSSDPSLIDHILSKFKSFKDKDSIGDWEISDLIVILESLFTHNNRPIFFLIDGVDEAVDAEDILKFLTSGITIRNTKWCISSRGEEIFQQAFSKYKGFKLNEYTRDDMLSFAEKEIQYALSSVQGYENFYTELFLQRLQRSLVNKAEGVYLWLVLALESIKRGLRNNDKEDVILSRLIKLPTRLEELYADMWDRLGEDKDIYQKEAVHYFKLLIAHHTSIDEYSKEYLNWKILNWSLTPFQIMLAQDDESQQDLLNGNELQLSQLDKKCLDMTKSISIKTSGLLVTRKMPTDQNHYLQVKAEYSRLNKHATSTTEFVHRTLFDFLRDTKPGKRILSQAQGGSASLQLAAVMLCQLRVYEATASGILTCGEPLHYLCWLLSQAQIYDTFSNERVFNVLLPAYENLFKASLIPWDQRSNKYPRPCFETLLLSDLAFQPFIKERLKSKGASYASRVLREHMFVDNTTSTRSNDTRIDILEFLHNLGADINSTNSCLYFPPLRVVIDGQCTNCLRYESPLSIMINQLFNYLDHTLYRKLSYLVAFLERSPNLDMHTSYSIPTLPGASVKPMSLNLGYIISEITKEENKITDSHPKRLGIPNRGLEAQQGYIITEVNLKYLLELYLKDTSSTSNHTAINALITRAQQLAQLEGSKAYYKARFIALFGPRVYSTEDFDDVGHRPLKACYQFINEDIDIFQEVHIPQSENVYPYGRDPTTEMENGKLGGKLRGYINECHEVDASALFTPVHQKLGACFEKPAGDYFLVACGFWQKLSSIPSSVIQHPSYCRGCCRYF